MKTVLLAAGMGTRLRPLTNSIPKCLVPIHGKPLLDYWLELTLNAEFISEVFVNLHYLKHKVSEHVATHWHACKNIHLFSEQHLQGTAGTLSGLHSALRGHRLLVVHADNLSDLDLARFYQAHQNRPSDCLMTMLLFKTDNPSSCGIVELDEQGRVLTMHEKVAHPPSNLANGAVYIFEPEVLDWIIANDATDISEEVIPAFAGKIATWLHQGYHRDIGNPKSYALAQQEFGNGK